MIASELTALATAIGWEPGTLFAFLAIFALGAVMYIGQDQRIDLHIHMK